MKNGKSNSNRGDLRRAVERDFRAHERRESSQKAFWESLGVLGAVGWPIALLTVGGALLGHWLHERYQLGLVWSVILMVGGAVIGCWTAWRVVGGIRR